MITIHQQLEAPPQLGEVDLWQYDPLMDAGELYYSQFKTFLMYLCSPSTEAIRVSALNTVAKSMQLTVYGPVCDFPEKNDQNRVYVRGTLTRTNLQIADESRHKVAQALKDKIIRDHPDERLRSNVNISSILSAVGLPRVK